jgi:bifunctional DNA-binding transcriptional regulator/antitoxin component of YhaV-PrlF toxin-antitoxin module
MSVIATITSKGQITLPRSVRQILKSNTVEIEIEGGRVIISPVQSVAGALSEFALPGSTFADERQKAWEYPDHAR